jgi:1,4-alpha-glucan branching enzyme
MDHPLHAGVQRLVADLNRLYRTEPALHEQDCQPRGFEWIDCNDAPASVISFLRQGVSTPDRIAVVCNFTPVPRLQHKVGVPFSGRWQELLNSDAAIYGGSGVGNGGGIEAEPEPCHGQPCSLTLAAPPLAVIFLKGIPPGNA